MMRGWRLLIPVWIHDEWSCDYRRVDPASLKDKGRLLRCSIEAGNFDWLEMDGGDKKTRAMITEYPALKSCTRAGPRAGVAVSRSEPMRRVSCA